jgi:hypothetical protein
MVMSGRTSTEALTQDASAYRVQPASVGLPPFEMRGKKMLDAECATGVDLTHGAYAEAAGRCGIDIDAKVIEMGRALYPMLDLRLARGSDSVRRWLL